MAAHTQKNNKLGKPGGKEAQPLIIAKTPAEEQRLKLERLMRNPDKPAPIPDRPKEWNPRAPPEFVRDVMGSSAGAGSGEFHVYRHLRRREYQRQDFLDKIAEKQNEDLTYLDKVEQNRRDADERTAKRRKKREKLKQKKQQAKKAKMEAKKDKEEDKSSESSDEKEDEEEEREADDDAEAPSFIMGRKWRPPPPGLAAGFLLMVTTWGSDHGAFGDMDTRITEQPLGKTFGHSFKSPAQEKRPFPPLFWYQNNTVSLV